MLVVALLVIPTLILEGTDVGDSWKTVAAVLNWLIWVAFAAELVAMLIVVRDRRRYLIHNPVNVAIVLLTPPFLPAIFQSLRAARLLRLAGLLRLAPIFRRAFSLRGVQYATVFTVLIIFTGAVAFAQEQPGKSYFDGIYWAVTTMTSVGYGDELPKTSEAKVVAMALMFVGVGYVAVLTGAIAERFIERGQEEEVEAVEADLSHDLGTELDRLAHRTRELMVDLEALRQTVREQAAHEHGDALR
jgi:voltage-gated potassium channel